MQTAEINALRACAHLWAFSISGSAAGELCGADGLTWHDEDLKNIILTKKKTFILYSYFIILQKWRFNEELKIIIIMFMIIVSK